METFLGCRFFKLGKTATPLPSRMKRKLPQAGQQHQDHRGNNQHNSQMQQIPVWHCPTFAELQTVAVQITMHNTVQLIKRQ